MRDSERDRPEDLHQGGSIGPISPGTPEAAVSLGTTFLASRFAKPRIPQPPPQRRSIIFRALAALSLMGVAGCSHRLGVDDQRKMAISADLEQVPSLAVVWPKAEKDRALAEGRSTFEKHQCARCHVIDGVKDPPQALHCVSCHTFLTGLKPSDETFKKISKKMSAAKPAVGSTEHYGADILLRYQRNIVHLKEVPSLVGLAKRVRPSWIADFLKSPYDVRPLLEESMIRHALSPDEIKRVVRYFAAEADVADPTLVAETTKAAPEKTKDASRILAGKGLFLERGCPSCHSFGNLDTGVSAKVMASTAGAQLAPNLRFARERTRADVLVDWIREPAKIKPGTAMPPFVGTASEAAAIADFLRFGDVPVPPAKVAPVTLPALLTRRVTYEEMKERTLGKVCVHCHMNDYEKDAGPGNLGGLGYKGIKLRMRTYEMLVSGAVGPDGERYSVLSPRPGETLSPLVLSLVRRRKEHLRDKVTVFDDHERPAYDDPHLGMPMGLPALDDEETAILMTWLSQGCEGPNKVTGLAETTDGLLVPDGPIDKNSGCEVRAPQVKRPDWATPDDALKKH